MKTGFFESEPGVKSSTRLMSFLALCVGLTLAVCAVFVSGVSFGDSFPMVLTLLGYSLGAKSFQEVAGKMNKDATKNGS